MSRRHQYGRDGECKLCCTMCGPNPVSTGEDHAWCQVCELSDLTDEELELVKEGDDWRAYAIECLVTDIQQINHVAQKYDIQPNGKKLRLLRVAVANLRSV